MKIKAIIKLDSVQVDAILGANPHLGSLKDLADHEYGLELSWIDPDHISVTGKMGGISQLVEEWQTGNIVFESFTEDDEL